MAKVSSQHSLSRWFLPVILIGVVLVILLAAPIIDYLQPCEPFIFDVSRFGEACLC